MSPNLSNFTKAAVFYSLALGLAVVVAWLWPNEILYMLTPLLATGIMLVVVSRQRGPANGWLELGLHRPRPHLLGLALFGPVVVMLLPFAIVWSIGLAGLQLPTGFTLLLLPLEFLITIALNSLFAIGEEIGWRGYLLPKLAGLGPGRAMLLTGFLHGLWHVPLIYLTSLYHLPGNQLIALPMFLLVLTVAGLFYGYLRFASGSVWPAVIAHGATNASLGLFASLTVASSPATGYLVGETGLLTLISLMVLAGWLMAKSHGISMGDSPTAIQPDARDVHFLGS